MNEFLEQFLVESRELIAQATDDLLALEHSPGDADRFDSAFRAFHTLKGAAGIMDFDAMVKVTHAAEDLLSEVRARARGITPGLVDDCLSCLDQITAWLAAMEASQGLPEASEAEAAQLIDRLTPGPHVQHAQPAQHLEGRANLPGFATDILREQIALLALDKDAGSTGRNGAALRVIQNILQRFALVSNTAVRAPSVVSEISSSEGETSREEASRPMRTDVARIEALVKIAGELVVVKNAFGHAVSLLRADSLAASQTADFVKLQGQLDRLTADMLRSILAARVLPLRQVFQRFPRLVREMASSLDKPVRLETAGDATEADRTIVEALFEPILHVLRNAVDHGIEPKVQRAAAGKSSPAVIRLSAARQGDEVLIEISDDGSGIDPVAIRSLAAARGLASGEALNRMPEPEVLELIFAPGFSTAKHITSLSGRGVGMDAVRAAIMQLGGQVELQSELGAGTTIRFHLPFTVMLSRVLMAEAGGQAFGVPFEAVVETQQFRTREIAALGAARAVFWRGRTLPLISLAGILNLPETESAELIQAVIVEQNGEFGAIQVERFGSQLEVMLKPLDGLLAGMPGIAGTALLGDGRVLIVLELPELLK